MTRELFEDMISNWLTDTSPNNDNLTITDIRFVDAEWVGYAEDDKHCYHLTDQDRDGNIVINYAGTK